MTQVFEGLKVVEFCQGMAGSLAAMILADNGADVIKVEPPGGDALRASPGFLTWNRGKKSVVLDLGNTEDRASAIDLILGSDLVIEQFETGTAKDHGLDFDAIAARRPDLVWCTINGLGMARAHGHLITRPEIVFAKSGRVNGNDLISGALFSDQPLFITSPIASFGAAGLAVQGVAAALYALGKSGIGDRVETSLLDGLSAMTMRLKYERQGGKVVVTRKQAAVLIWRGIMLCFLTARCKDGRYIQMCARQDHHFRNWMGALGLEQLLKEERFGKAPLGFTKESDIDEIEKTIRAHMVQKTQAEWMELFRTTWDVGADPFLTPEEFLNHPQMVENGRIVTIDDPEHGPVRQVGPLVLFSDTPSRIESPAPALGAHQAELAALASRTPAPAKPAIADAVKAAPLAGVTILELANFLAAPVGATLLAELGARVIKIEPLDGDSYRRTGLEAVQILNGKESLPVDLKTPEGHEIFTRAVRGADALVHNFRPGVPERLGVDYETVRTINPSLVYLYAASYGAKGPEKHRPAFHSTPHALCGGGILQGGRGNPPVDDSYPDPCAGNGVGMALAMGLLAREKTGRGQYLETTMLTSSGYVHGERLTLYKNAPELPSLDSRQLGYDALDRLYPCRTGWFMLAATRTGEWERLARTLGRTDWLSDPRFADPAQRRANDEALTMAIADAFAGKDGPALERSLSEAGVPAAAVSESFQEFMVDNDLVLSGEHPIFGTYWRLKPRTRFTRRPNRLGEPSAIGEHTHLLLTELGYGPAEIEKLLDRKVVITAKECART